VCARVSACCAGLSDIHVAAQADESQTREEVDSLLNLIARLDFNDFFKAKPDLNALLAAAQLAGPPGVPPQ
jgi:hypothetical protein